MTRKIHACVAQASPKRARGSLQGKYPMYVAKPRSGTDRLMVGAESLELLPRTKGLPQAPASEPVAQLQNWHENTKVGR